MLTLELNSKKVEEDGIFKLSSGHQVLMTPSIDEDYWLVRVPLTENQAVVGFPKFGLIGIGFQNEDDWNTNLPSTCSAKQILDHIKHNKGDDSISDEDCLEAIQMIQEYVTKAEEATNATSQSN